MTIVLILMSVKMISYVVLSNRTSNFMRISSLLQRLNSQSFNAVGEVKDTTKWTSTIN